MKVAEAGTAAPKQANKFGVDLSQFSFRQISNAFLIKFLHVTFGYRTIARRRPGKQVETRKSAGTE